MQENVFSDQSIRFDSRILRPKPPIVEGHIDKCCVELGYASWDMLSHFVPMNTHKFHSGTAKWDTWNMRQICDP